MKPVTGTKIAQDLKGRVAVLTYGTLDSTNSEARRYIGAGLLGAALFISDEQTKGRGRLGRSFYSPKDSGVYMTLAYPIKAAYGKALRVTAKAAVSCLRGIRDVLHADVSVKWVNDLYFGSRKAAGILVESVPGDTGVDWVVIGIGINLGNAAFPQELRETAVSLKAAECDRNELITAIVSDLLWELKHIDDLSYLDDYRAYSNVLGENILFGRAPDMEEGRAVAIDDEGALVVEKSDGTRLTLSSGEISVRKKHEGPDHT